MHAIAGVVIIAENASGRREERRGVRSVDALQSPRPTREEIRCKLSLVKVFDAISPGDASTLRERMIHELCGLARSRVDGAVPQDFE